MFLNDMKFISRIFQSFYIKLLAPICILCGQKSHNFHNLCVACEKELPILKENCRKCAQILTAHHANVEWLCGKCLRESPPFDRTFALFPYEFPIIQLITRLKFQHQLCFAKTLGHLFATKIVNDWYRHMALPDLLIPIPLHHDRLRERGFNQALEIAKPISERCPIQIDYKNTKRSKATLAQSGLSAIKRKQNIANAFLASRDYSGLTIAVIDDVVTTAQTMIEFCKLLKKQGARSIHVWCCARR